MRRIAIIYTVRPVLDTFSQQLAALLPFDVKFHHLYDDFLASDPQEKGRFTHENLNRLYNDVRNCELTGAEIIITTCSTLTPAVQSLRPFFSTPIVAIDDAMCMEAVKKGARITVLATARSTIEPTVSHIMQMAQEEGVPVTITSSDDEIAYEAMKRGDLETHDQRVLERVRNVENADVIVLAQASMAHLASRGEALSGVPVLASIPLCLASVAAMLKETP
ncbi:MAG: aspartate/glutamate racemase family protein [Sphaerochaetaceae bacterium]|nr:aspartate/glutamate racemase family protein [Sphaerochaetaceae bacterium]